MKTEKEKVGKSNVTGNVFIILFVFFETVIHETMHAVCAWLTGSGCSGIVLSSNYWYMKPLEWITFGFYSIQELGPGTGGYASLSFSDSFWGHISMIIAGAAPEMVYLTFGIYLIWSAYDSCKEKFATGMIQLAAGGLCLSSTFSYMRISMFGAQPGHDYYNVTASILSIFWMPKTWASFMTPFTIIIMFALAYSTAKMMKKDKQEA